MADRDHGAFLTGRIGMGKDAFMESSTPQPGDIPDDGIIRELPRIARYARKNENDDLRFRTYLKVHLPLSDRELDRVVQKVTEEVWSQIDCTTCANCCKTLQIVVDNTDIARLAKKQGMSTKSFRERYVGVDEEGDQYFTATPCPFLGEDNRCTVYEDRPKACRDFPYLHEAHFRSRTFSMIDNAAVCPIVFNVWDRLKQRFRRRTPPRRQRWR
jgi:Fe-S-cluster containining protein